MSNTRNYLMSIPMPMATAGDAVVWAAEHFDNNIEYDETSDILRFYVYDDLQFTATIEAIDEHASLLKLVATHETPDVIARAYEAFAKVIAETYDGVYDDSTPVDTSLSESYFDGGLLQWLGWKVLGTFLTCITVGICYPWACCMLYAWETKHTVINGRRLHFTGTALGLFGHWIKWWFLCLITGGIYSFWLNIKLKKWITSHTITT